jgi:hypothetical protein
MLKQPRVKDKNHLKFISTLPCCVSGLGEVQAAHIRKGNGGGMGLKPPDNFTVPLNYQVHARQHHLGAEDLFWAEYGGIDNAISLANALYENTGNSEACLRLIRDFRINSFS